jgi:hypothetical protein
VQELAFCCAPAPAGSTTAAMAMPTSIEPTVLFIVHLS